jgi:hypothetical protein
MVVEEPKIIIGPHLLGRVYEPDSRDWSVRQLEQLIDSQKEIHDGANLEEVRQKVGEQPPQWWIVLWQIIAAIFTPKPSPNPPIPPDPPPAPTGNVFWTNPQKILNQANTPHCVGFSWCQWGNVMPVTDAYLDADGHRAYYECKVIDGQAMMENGSSIRSGALAMRNRKRLSAFANAKTVEEMSAWLKRGPIVVGTDWTQGMFQPNAKGVIKPTGASQGGHAYLIDEVRAETNDFGGTNSWGAQWGQQGRFTVSMADFAKLLSHNGDATCALELPIPGQ